MNSLSTSPTIAAIVPTRTASERAAEIDLYARAMSRTLARFADFGDLRSFVEATLLEVLESVGSRHGGVVLLDEEDGVPLADYMAVVQDGVLLSQAFKERHNIARFPLQPYQHAFIARLDLTGAAPHGHDADVSRPEFKRYMRANHILQVYPVAIRAGGKMIGWMSAAYQRELLPDENPTHFLASLADPMAIAVEFFKVGERAKATAIARLRSEAEERRAREFERFNGELSLVTATFIARHDLDDSLGITLRCICGHFDGTAAAGSAWLIDDDASEPVFRTALRDGRVVQADAAGTACKPIDARIVETHAPWDRPFVVSRASMATQRTDGANEDDSSRLVVVPMTVSSRLIGYFVVDVPAAMAEIDDEILQLVQIFGYQATVSVHLHRLSERSQRAARIDATLAERTRITRDLGDSLANGLTGILHHLEASQRTSEPESAHTCVANALVAARATLLESRRSVRALRVPPTGRLDLATALRGVLRTVFIGSRISVDVRSNVRIWINQATETELIMIAQCVATKTTRYPAASRFSVRLGSEANAIQMFIEDDTGRPLGSPVEAEEGPFMSEVRDRSRRIGASVVVENASGETWRLRITVRGDAAVHHDDDF